MLLYSEPIKLFINHMQQYEVIVHTHTICPLAAQSSLTLTDQQLSSTHSASAPVLVVGCFVVFLFLLLFMYFCCFVQTLDLVFLLLCRIIIGLRLSFWLGLCLLRCIFCCCALLLWLREVSQLQLQFLNYLMVKLFILPLHVSCLLSLLVKPMMGCKRLQIGLLFF